MSGTMTRDGKTFDVTDRLPMGPCHCPPAVDGAARHPDGEWMVLKKRLLYGDIRRVASAMLNRDPEQGGLGMAMLAVRSIVEWSLEDGGGQRLPIVLDAIDELEQDNSTPMIRVLNGPDYAGRILGTARNDETGEDEPVVKPAVEPVPNGSSGSSPDGSAEPSDSATFPTT